MKTLIDFLPEETVWRLGWTLVHFVWEGAAIALITAVVLGVMRRGSANGRYAVGCAGLLLMVAVAGATFWVLPGPDGEIAAAASNASAGAANEPSDGGRDARPPDADGWETTPNDASIAAGRTPLWPPLAKGEQAPAASLTPQHLAAAPQQAVMTSQQTTAWWHLSLAGLLEPYLAWLVAAWLVGTAGLSVRLLAGWGQVQRLRRRLVEQVSPRWQEVLSEVAERLRVSRPVKLLVSAAARGPMTVGWLRPVVLVPVSALTGLTAEQLRAVLAHELAHIRQFDYLANIVQSAIETVLFYHPAVWWVSRRIRAEREHCCDDAAVEVCGGALRYARALERLETLRAAPVRLAAAAHGGKLLARIRRLVVPQASESSRWSGWAAGAIPLLLVAGLALSVRLMAAPATGPAGSGIRPAPDPAKVTQSAANLSKLAKALRTYDNDTLPGEVPEPWDAQAELAAAVMAGVLDAKLLRSPLAPNDPKPAYIWLKRGSSDARDIVAYENPAHFDNQGTVVMYSDAHTEYVNLAGFQAMMKRQEGAESRPAEAVTTQPAAAEAKYRLRHFVRLVVGKERMTFQGKELTLVQLPEELKQVPNRASTVLELAYEAEGVKLEMMDEAALLMLSQRLGFDYLSYIGVHPIGSMGSPSLRVLPEERRPSPVANPPTTQPAKRDVAQVRRAMATPFPARAVPFKLPPSLSWSGQQTLGAHDGKLRWTSGAKEILLDSDRGNVHVLWNDGRAHGEGRAAVIEIPLGAPAGIQHMAVDTVDGLLRLRWTGKSSCGVEVTDGRVVMYTDDGTRTLTAGGISFTLDTLTATQPVATQSTATQTSATPISVRGVVLLPNGKRAVGAEVVLIPPGHEARFSGTQYTGLVNMKTGKPLKEMSVRTDAEGKFLFPEECAGIALAAVHEEGYVDLSQQAGKYEHEIRLQPWARLEGVIFLGRVLSGDDRLQFSAARAYDANGPLADGSTRNETVAGVSFRQSLETSLTGEYTIEKAPPGACSLQPHSAYPVIGGEFKFDLDPGEERRVKVGAGRTVRGRLVAPAGSGVVITPEHTHLMVMLYQRPIMTKTYPVYAVEPAYDEFLKSFVGQAYMRESIPVDADGRFEIADLPPGKYFIQAKVNKGVTQDDAVDMLGSLSSDMTVEDLGEGPGGKPMELGDLTLTLYEAATRPSSDTGPAPASPPPARAAR